MFMEAKYFLGHWGFDSDDHLRRDPPLVRVEKMVEALSKLPGAPKFMFVLLRD